VPERCYNALRVAGALIKKDAEADVTVFLMADAVIGAKASQLPRAITNSSGC
jgi:uncharacterized protein involved in oxidation of intracellular sulfur